MLADTVKLMEVALPKEDLELVSVRRGLSISFNIALQMALQMKLVTSHSDDSGTIMIGPPNTEPVMQPAQAMAPEDPSPRPSLQPPLAPPPITPVLSSMPPPPVAPSKAITARQVSDAVRALAHAGTLAPMSVRGPVFHTNDSKLHEEIIRAAVASGYMRFPRSQNPFQATLDPFLNALCAVLGRTQSEVSMDKIIEEVRRKCSYLSDVEIRDRLLAASYGEWSLLIKRESAGNTFFRWHHPSPPAPKGKVAVPGSRKRPRSTSPKR